jgi:hypothetical protein
MAEDQTSNTTREPVEGDGLSEQERKFVTAYLREGNATEAARQAGLKWPGQYGGRLLKTEKIRRVISAELEAWRMDRASVAAALTELCYVNIGDFLDNEGCPVVSKVLAKGHLIKQYKCTILKTMDNGDKLVSVSIKLYDRHVALRDMARIQKMLSSDCTEFVETLRELIVRAADAELPKEMAGRLLRRVGNDLQAFRN